MGRRLAGAALGWLALIVFGFGPGIGAGSIARAAEPSPAASGPPQPLVFGFDTDLEGWTRGVAGRKGRDDNWGTVYQLPRDGGIVQLDGTGRRGRPNAWISKSIALPIDARTLDFDVSGHDTAVSDSHLTVRIEDDSSDNVVVDEIVSGAAHRLTFRTERVDIARWAGMTVTVVFEQDDNGVGGVFPGADEQILLDNIRIASDCDLKGIVYDGGMSIDAHHNPLAGIPVDLSSGGVPVGRPMVTGPDGGFCVPGGSVTPGDYELRASLVDAAHSPSVFQTRAAGQTEAASATADVTAADFGRQDFDVTFSSTAAPRLADIANIHWQASRFVEWLVDVLVLDPAKLTGLVIEANSPDGTAYDSSARTISIEAGDTPFAKRQGPTTECPENCEWHEISHHVAKVLGIAPTATAPACAGRTNHGGWLNDTTCDSLSEGFAVFLSTLASLDIDAGLGAGYATPRYSSFGSLEDNGYRPWSVSPSGAVQREDFAVAQLLWDLADDTPNEPAELGFYTGSLPRTGTVEYVDTTDRVALDGVRLVHLLAFATPTTVADVYDDLVADRNVAAPLKTADFDINGDGDPDLSPLDGVFLEHGFHPGKGWDSWKLGDPIALTQPGAHNLRVRRDEELVPGSAIRVQNVSDSAATVSIDVAYPSTSEHLEVVVEPRAERLVHLELPPYWSGLPPDDGTLPACANPDPWPVTVTIAAPGSPSRTVSSCEYLQAVAATSGDAAVTYAIGVAAAAPTAPPVQPAAPTVSPIQSAAPEGTSGGVIATIAALAVAALAIGGFVLFRRQRR